MPLTLLPPVTSLRVLRVAIVTAAALAVLGTTRVPYPRTLNFSIKLLGIFVGGFPEAYFLEESAYLTAELPFLALDYVFFINFDFFLIIKIYYFPLEISPSPVRYLKGIYC